MSITAITTHIVDALDRLIEQYKGSESIRNLLTALVEQIQDAEDAGNPLFNRLDLSSIEGESLDLFGSIVLQDREGLSDDLYRIFLEARIGVNVSNGEPERIISNFKLLSQADLIHYMNLNDGDISLGTDGEIEAGLENTIFRLMQLSPASGVRITEYVFFDDTEPFAFDGPTTVPGAGFGTVSNPSIGGLFATLQRLLPEFAFDGADSNPAGFGTIDDPLIGGGLVTV